MILGIGVDIVEMKHFKSVIKKTPTLLKRIFTEQERNRANKLTEVRKIAYYAKRYAGKEAVSKACGTGIGENIGWQDIEILNDTKGGPVILLSPKAIQFLTEKFKVKKITPFISLSDEKEGIIAFSVLTN